MKMMWVGLTKREHEGTIDREYVFAGKFITYRDRSKIGRS